MNTCLTMESGVPGLTEDFIRENADKVHWARISRCQTLSENFIREFKHKVDWEEISEFQKLSENFIREFKERLYWSRISRFQKLSANFIREMYDYADWYYIYLFQDIKEVEPLILEYKEVLDIDWVCTYITLSKEFVINNIDILNIECLLKNNKLDDELKNRLEKLKVYL